MNDICVYNDQGNPCDAPATHAVQCYWDAPGIWTPIHLIVPMGKLVAELCETHAQALANQYMRRWNEAIERHALRKERHQDITEDGV